jgi:hypothetical protein
MKNSDKLRSYLVLGALISFLFMPQLSNAQPKIVFEQEVHNFGEVMQGEVVENTFVFHNKGNEELVIDKVSPS